MGAAACIWWLGLQKERCSGLFVRYSGLGTWEGWAAAGFLCVAACKVQLSAFYLAAADV
ncbi:hypothetical protein TIFTF001_017578 [Ficus carica]|uniref:Uncharacterized protein n=1 Tax=Ficus carica TaxID=3494 RepID=A0AA88A5A6_FICCA|nr:hypothetical protein TIFTF001_017578 [Ficus carica]